MLIGLALFALFPPEKWFGLSWAAADDRGVLISIQIVHLPDDLF